MFCIFLALAVSAVAITPRVVLNYIPPGSGLEEAPYSGPALTYVFFLFEEAKCEQIYGGTVDNERPLLRDTLEEVDVGTECEMDHPPTRPYDTYSTTAGYKRVTLDWDGQVRLVGKSVITMPGPCVYSFSDPVLTLFEGASASAGGEGTAKGALVEKDSLVTCPLIDSVPIEVGLDHPGADPQEGARPLFLQIRG